jgi:hypothetical protein
MDVGPRGSRFEAVSAGAGPTACRRAAHVGHGARSRAVAASNDAARSGLSPERTDRRFGDLFS